MKNKFAFTLAEVLITLVIIGVVAALTIPTAISKYRRTTVETGVKNAFSTLSNAVKRATADHGDIALWEIDNTDDFLNKYMLPYIRNSKGSCSDTNLGRKCQLTLSNGTIWEVATQINFYLRQKDGLDHNYIKVNADINGKAKPNKAGYDQFLFYIFPYPAEFYNSGNCHIAYHVTQPGVYYDGYNISKNELLTNVFRGCAVTCSEENQTWCRYYCTAILARNGWKVPDDYPLNL